MEKHLKKRKNIVAVYLSVFLIVIFIGTYMAIFAEPLQFGPESEGMSYANARAFLLKLEGDGIKWYCGEVSSYTDSQGNSYGSRELNEMKKILGNEELLRKEFCD